MLTCACFILISSVLFLLSTLENVTGISLKSFASHVCVLFNLYMIIVCVCVV